MDISFTKIKILCYNTNSALPIGAFRTLTGFQFIAVCAFIFGALSPKI